MSDLYLTQNLKWIGQIQPEGLVVSAHTLADAVLVPTPDTIALQHRFLEHWDDDLKALRDTSLFLTDFLGWHESFIVRGKVLPDDLRITLENFGDCLEPTLALRTNPRDSEATKAPWLVLVREEPAQTDFDTVHAGAGWQASPHARMERLLRETSVPVGVLITPQVLRLVYAPRGENAGHMTFRFEDLATNAGRTLLAALEMLLGTVRLWSAPTKKRLPYLLRTSRESQARVSAELSQQVLASLYELLRGFAQADQQANQQLLSELVDCDPQNVYQGLLTVILRLVFLLYAEDYRNASGRCLMPDSDIYQRNYSVHGLWARLRDDAQQHQDTMDRRFGAWAQLLSLFKMVHGGCRHPDLKLPPRLGHLFDPSRFPFLEGPEGSVPLVPDRTLFIVLDKLLVLAGEKLSYRTLDVEQIGSVYESIMGFTLQTVQGLSIALKPAKKHGAPPVLDLEALLAVAPAKRDEFVKDATDRKLSSKLANELKAARTVDDLLAVFRDLLDLRATPSPIPRGGWVLAPTEERRKSGSHYTPRSLSAPVVEKALKPVWLRLGPNPTPEAIQDLRICDPAMGSGAFLVETCRQVAERLVESWKAHNAMPEIPPDEDELLYARRVVAQRCLYGVDRNPMAVDLAKLSLWLATLAKDHPFTFLDHSLRAGDSLVGLSRRQAVDFHWSPEGDQAFGSYELDDRLRLAQQYRLRILQGDDHLLPAQKAEQLRLADSALEMVRQAADLTLSAFFAESKPKAREILRKDVRETWGLARSQPILLKEILDRAGSLRSGAHPISPFHWELEFPEVFFPRMGDGDKTRYGFDVIVGNPPFIGVTDLGSSTHPCYTDWLRIAFENSGGKSDLCAFFFRAAFNLLRDIGSFGFVATNSISQGDTRRSGLRQIVRDGGKIYSAIRRRKWPGIANVIVSVIHCSKKDLGLVPELDEVPKANISPFLIDSNLVEDPKTLNIGQPKAYLGSKVQGIGFVFDDRNSKCPSLALLEEIKQNEPRWQEVVRPYIGGEDLMDLPTIEYPRWAIDMNHFDSLSKAEEYPVILNVVKTFVMPTRIQSPGVLKKCWWHYGHKAEEFYAASAGRDEVLVIARNSNTFAFEFLKSNGIVNDKIVGIFGIDLTPLFSVSQSRIHEIWARTLCATLKDDLQYTPTDCFENFPFPRNWEKNPELETVGREYREFRAALMARHNEGLTKTYNRFHDPEHDGTGIDGVDSAQVVRDIEELRRLHNELDRAVLAAYGWTDIDSNCIPVPDFEEEEDEDSNKKGKGRRKKPWRLRFPDAVRDDILARLLKLNAQYAREEGQELAPTPRFAARPKPDSVATTSKPAAKPRKPKGGNEAQGSLL